MTEAVVFNPEGKNMLPADLLYKKDVFAVRGSFRPVTSVSYTHLDVYKRQIYTIFMF